MAPIALPLSFARPRSPANRLWHGTAAQDIAERLMITNISIEDRGPPPHCPSPFNLARYVLWENGADDDKVALAVVSPTGARRLSYGSLRERVQAAATDLLSRGLAKGDRVLMRLGNTETFPIIFLGAAYAGLVPVPTSSALTAPEISAISKRLRPKIVITDGSGALPSDTTPVIDTSEMKTALTAAADMGNPDRPGYIVFTSGTSGTPTGVVHAHRAIWGRRAMHKGWYDISPNDRMMHAGAFNWTFTLGTGLLDPWSVGATALVPAEGVDATTLPLLLKRFDATLFAAAPGVFRRLLRTPNFPDLPYLRHALSAGEKLPEMLRQSWHDKTGTDIHEAFGQSEVSTFVSGAPDRPAPPGTLGFAQPGRRIAILGPKGPIARGEVGDIAIDVRDPGLMIGYLDADEATTARRKGNWYLTGDIGAMANDGAIEYKGRSDEILTAGGYRVSPLEIETVMLAHNGVDDCAAVDLAITPDTTVIALFYVGDADESSLKAHAGQSLANYKIPRVFKRLEALPRSANGKLLRRKLKTTDEDQG